MYYFLNWNYMYITVFSGVLFALKVVTTHMLPPGITYVMGCLPVHSRIACWVELVVIQILVPNASFIGKLKKAQYSLYSVKFSFQTYIRCKVSVC